MDEGYDSKKIKELTKVVVAYTSYIRSRREEERTLAKEEGCKAQRWVEKRTRGWHQPFPADACPVGKVA